MDSQRLFVYHFYRQTVSLVWSKQVFTWEHSTSLLCQAPETQLYHTFYQRDRQGCGKFPQTSRKRCETPLQMVPNDQFQTFESLLNREKNFRKVIVVVMVANLLLTSRHSAYQVCDGLGNRFICRFPCIPLVFVLVWSRNVTTGFVYRW